MTSREKTPEKIASGVNFSLTFLYVYRYGLPKRHTSSCDFITSDVVMFGRCEALSV